MGLRVDRQAALGWLGIEGFRPSGRVPLPVGEPVADGAESDTDASPVDDRQGVEMAERFGTPSRQLSPEISEPAAPVDVPAEPVTPVAAPQPTEAAPADRLSVTAESPHRALAEAIARVAGLACETGEDDLLVLGGERWGLSTLAGDGQAKRRLWRVLTERARRPRG
ncbi:MULTISPECIES: hypothetical protein [unclassified Guyparkeria]|uniref:hypothetical protein n=1 Tax=unclassified Guyparkeria TaxID=2626246 RepID=UPI0007337E3E|nr:MULTISPECIES: hypothetical protein [unclassified Guyparkeria]KTG16398.1 hypothetical protein AUR63_03325 [Guyparkeria sp. XI15]OAE85338.1 hypothetical protein AWR35_03330 [Guyparkeria sp. WRN-7]